MAKGNIAKERVMKKIQEAFGADYVGEYDKKIYLWADDGGNKVQIAISLTCPKVYRGVEETGPSELSFDDDETAAASVAENTFQPAEITKEEQDTLEALMKRLGL